MELTHEEKQILKELSDLLLKLRELFSASPKVIAEVHDGNYFEPKIGDWIKIYLVGLDRLYYVEAMDRFAYICNDQNGNKELIQKEAFGKPTYLQRPTNEEICAHLKKISIEKGYGIGVKIRKIGSDCVNGIIEEFDLWYDSTDDALRVITMDDDTPHGKTSSFLWRKDIWAEIIEDKKLTYEYVEQSFRKNGKWMGFGNSWTTSFTQTDKIFALNKLLNVVKYLNQNGVILANTQYFYAIDHKDNLVVVSENNIFNAGIPMFNSEELAIKAKEILGEETIRLALTTDY